MKQLYFFITLMTLSAFTAWSQSPSENLIVNGDFQLGNQGFVSDYKYMEISRFSLYREGVYNITSDPSHSHRDFRSMYDHTKKDSSGLFMAVNGMESSTASVVWKQTVVVQPNTEYQLSVWAITLQRDTINLSRLQFEVDNQVIGTSFKASAMETWQQYQFTWKSGNRTTVDIAILNLDSEYHGNDFGIDDIVLIPLKK